MPQKGLEIRILQWHFVLKNPPIPTGKRLTNSFRGCSFLSTETTRNLTGIRERERDFSSEVQGPRPSSCHVQDGVLILLPTVVLHTCLPWLVHGLVCLDKENTFFVLHKHRLPFAEFMGWPLDVDVKWGLLIRRGESRDLRTTGTWDPSSSDSALPRLPQ